MYFSDYEAKLHNKWYTQASYEQGTLETKVLFDNVPVIWGHS